MEEADLCTSSKAKYVVDLDCRTCLKFYDYPLDFVNQSWSEVILFQMLAIFLMKKLLKLSARSSAEVKCYKFMLLVIFSTFFYSYVTEPFLVRIAAYCLTGDREPCI